MRDTYATRVYRACTKCRRATCRLVLRLAKPKRFHTAHDERDIWMERVVDGDSVDGDIGVTLTVSV